MIYLLVFVIFILMYAYQFEAAGIEASDYVDAFFGLRFFLLFALFSCLYNCIYCFFVFFCCDVAARQ